MATAKKTAAPDIGMEAFAPVNPETFKKGYEKFAKGVSEFADFQKASLDAVIASAGSFAKAVEKAAAENSAFAKTSYEDGVAAFRAAAGSKSVQEAFDIQSDYLRSTFEKNLGQFNKMADHWISTSKEASEPLTTRYGEFVEIIQSYRP
ncbi:MAG TPA: phasin family protein [Parvularculaceae bacterium]|nr:phasin family protein [Parvularculaceae bacterium]